VELIFIFKIYPYVFKLLSINFGNYLYKTFQTSDVSQTSDVWEIIVGATVGRPYEAQGKGSNRKEHGAK
jgi:hypothetical protein